MLTLMYFTGCSIEEQWYRVLQTEVYEATIFLCSRTQLLLGLYYYSVLKNLTKKTKKGLFLRKCASVASYQ